MAFKKVIVFSLLCLALSLSFLADGNAASINLICRIGSNGSRSVIKMRATGLKGKYYAKIFSGEHVMQAEDKPTNSNGVVEFKFDSDPGFLTNYPNTTRITPDFIINREVVGVLRKAGSLARIGAVRAACRNIKGQATGLQ